MKLSSRFFPIFTLFTIGVCSSVFAADGVTLTWDIKSAWPSDRVPLNPMSDSNGESVWYFLRTSRREGTGTARRWLRDGRYASLTKSGTKMFGGDRNGWLFRDSPDLAPFISQERQRYNVGLQFERGDIGIAPGPDHAIVIGWRSPVSGQAEITGAFEHAQSCCGINSRINWYVERGPAPDLKNGFKPNSLASGHSDFGTKSQAGKFLVKDQPVELDDFFYFIADAHADGTGTVHYGDHTRFSLTITVRNAVKRPPPRFETDIRPILARACGDCHGADTREAHFDIRTVTSILQGGESGHGIVRGDPARSAMLDMIVRNQMPPDDAEKLSQTEVSLLRRWIKAGAPAHEKVVELPPRTEVTDEDRSFWAFQTPVKRPLPAVSAIDRVRTPIDRFVLHRLEDKGLGFSADADRAKLMRRAYFNLIGLPPSLEEIDEFLNDDAPDAWERLIDRLLDSPHYGERWGRHWLDAAGYVDNRLFDGDLATIYPNEGIWKYRDYVVRAFNSDKPYDRFVTEQLAGDQLVDWRNAETFTDEIRELLAATGYFRSIEDHTSEPQYGISKRYEVVFDTMKMVSTSLMGLTLECCRCHNHKFDPIPQRDYYRLMATIEPALNPHNWLRPQDRWLADVSPARRKQIDAHNGKINGQLAELSKQLKEAEQGKDKSKADKLKSEIARLNQTKQSYGKIQALFDVGDIPSSRVLRRGDPLAPGILIEPGFLQVLSKPTRRAEKPKTTATGSTGMRLSLANWLTARDHPLTARVIVNRIWHHHFGRGFVETPGNFGRSGSLPTHPDLLDWLAVDLMEHGWSLKRLHRVIMSSTVFRQRSARSQLDDPSKIDPDNKLLWRMNLRRIESEIIRDSVIAVSGQIDLTPGGPPVMISKPADGLSRVEHKPTPTSHNRRSIYLFARRVYPLKFMEVFDAPIVPVNCTRRRNSATVLQSFTFLNSQFMTNQSATLANRVAQLAVRDSRRQIETAWLLALSRRPVESEFNACESFLEDQAKTYATSGQQPTEAATNALADLCQMIFSTNEFLYVE